MENVMSKTTLYFAPLACSMASRIALYEAGADADFTYVDTRAKAVEGGGDFFAVNPMGQVPVLVTQDGRTITENVAVLQYVADQYPLSCSPLQAAGTIIRRSVFKLLSVAAAGHGRRHDHQNDD